MQLEISKNKQVAFRFIIAFIFKTTFTLNYFVRLSELSISHLQSSHFK